MHPQICAAPPLHFFREVAKNWFIKNLHGADSSEWHSILTRLKERIKIFIPNANFLTLDDLIEGKNFYDFPMLFRCIFEDIINTNNREIIFIKENNIYEYLDLIDLVCKDKKFIYQVRDPRDFLLSAYELKSNGIESTGLDIKNPKYLFGGPNKFGSAKQALEIWCKDQLMYLSVIFGAASREGFIGRYEDLLRNPEIYLKSICKFLDINYEPKMLNFSISEYSNRVGNIAARKNIQKPLMRDNSEKYKKHLSEVVVGATNAWCYPLLKLFRYKIDFQKFEEKSFNQLVMYPYIFDLIENIKSNTISPSYHDSYDLKLLSSLGSVSFSYEYEV
jgi:hypothetical protein